MIAPKDTVKTFSPKPRDIERRWYVIDANGAVLGRLASEVAKILRGKHKPIFAPHMDTGDHVIVVNARSVRVTGGKEDKKVYVRHSGYPGGLTRMGFSRLMSRRPAQVVEKAITGMLPKNRLGRQMARKLAVYEGPEHPHQAQRPVALSLGQIPTWEGLPKPKPEPAAPKAQPAKEGTARRERPAGEAKPASRPKGRRAAAKSSAGGRTTASPRRGAGRKAQADSEAAPSRSSSRAAAKSTAAKKTTARKATADKADDKGATRRRSRARKKSEKES